MVFNNRHQAAQLLAEALAAYKSQHPLILAIPRGAVAIDGMEFPLAKTRNMLHEKVPGA